MSAFNNTYSNHPIFRVHHQQTHSTRRHEGFASLNEFINPKLRPRIHINTVGRLIHYHFKRLEKMIQIMKQQQGECTVYLPWSSTGWGFAIFQPSFPVKQLINRLALLTERNFADQPNVTFVKNIWDPNNPETDYSFLVQHKRNILLVFGDNTTGKGKGGTAAVRDHPNAFGIPTGWSDSFGVWTDKMENEYEEAHYLDYILERQEDVKRYTLDTREDAVVEREQEVSVLQQNLEARFIALSKREEDIAKKEKEVQELRSELKARDMEVRQKETLVSQKEARQERRRTLANK